MHNNAPYHSFLKSHTTKKEFTDKPSTNTRIGNKDKDIYGGNYHINDQDYSTFIELYHAHVFEQGNKEYLTEAQHIHGGGPLLVDLDLHFSLDIKERLYTKDHIDDLIDTYLKELKSVYTFDANTKFPVYVLEKAHVNPVSEKNMTKDGIHLIFGLGVEHRQVHLYIRDKIVTELSNMWEDLPIINTWKDVVDEGIAHGTTNWQMYGSRKPDHEAYTLTYIHDITFDPSDSEFMRRCRAVTGIVSIDELKQMSARNKVLYNPIYRPSFIENYLVASSTTAPHKSSASRNTSLTNKKTSPFIQNHLTALFSVTCRDELKRVVDELLADLEQSREYDLIDTFNYTMILPPEKYCVTGTYDRRMRVGWALRNIDDRMFIVWIYLLSLRPDFTYPTSIQNYYAEWLQFDMNRPDGLTQRSIMHWSKSENEAEFTKIRDNSVSKYIHNLIKNPDSGDVKTAELLFHLFKDEYVCASIKGKIWYRFCNHRWAIDETGTTLRSKISGQLHELFADIHRAESTRVAEIKDNEDEKNRQLKKLAKMAKIQSSLCSTSSKNNVMTEAMEFFYDSHFLEKMDLNPYLLCFTNGVIDFKETDNEGYFRPGRPEDCITKSTGITYLSDKEVSTPKAMRIMDEIRLFMRQLFPIEDLHTYMWEHLASILIGIAANQTFNMYIGHGQNGKSVLMDLMSKILGEYKGSVPLRMVTGRRAEVGGLTPELVELKGTRYGVMQEATKGDKINDGIMKELTSGKDTIQCRAPYMTNTLKYLPQFKLAICSNERLEIGEATHGTWRRIREVPFPSLFTENPVQGDPLKPYQFKLNLKIDEKFDEWKEYFMYMLVKVAVRTKGLVEDCPTVMGASNAYQQAQDVMALFFKEKIEKLPNSPKVKLSQTQLRDCFKQWFINLYGEKNVPKPMELYTRFEKEYGKPENNIWKGIGIIMVETEDDEDETCDIANDF